MKGISRFLFWDYRRASWQYDVMVGLILMFIFLMPREIFKDQPSPAANVVMLRGGFWIAPQLLEGVPQDQLLAKAQALVKSRYKSGYTSHEKNQAAITSVEPINDEANKEVTGYMAFTKP
jgi:hypothetical protein